MNKYNKKTYAYGILGMIVLVLILLVGGLKAYSVWKHFNYRLDAIIDGIDDYPTYVDLTIDGYEVRLDMQGNSGHAIELPTLNVEWDLKISATGKENYETYFNEILIESDEFKFRLERISQDYNIPILVKNKKTGATKKFFLNTFPEALPTYRVVGKSPYEGDYYITPLPGSCAYKINSNGEVLYYRIAPSGILDFKKVVTPDGVRYLLFENRNSQHIGMGFIGAGEYIVMDEQYHEINRLKMKKSDKITSDNWPTDEHDLLYISDNEYYMFTYFSKNVNNIPDDIPHKENGALVTGALIQGYKDGELFFEWDSTDFPELYSASSMGNDFTNLTPTYADYVHMNSLEIDKRDGNLIISCRHLDTVMKIDTKTGKILWKLGGLYDDFNLTPEQKTSKQHYARYTENGSITVYDNGNANKQSRVVEYWLDEEKKELKDFKEYKIENYFSEATGSAQRVSLDQDIFVVGWGWRSEGTPEAYPNMSEINFTTGETLFEFRFDNRETQTYRCVKY